MHFGENGATRRDDPFFIFSFPLQVFFRNVCIRNNENESLSEGLKIDHLYTINDLTYLQGLQPFLHLVNT